MNTRAILKFREALRKSFLRLRGASEGATLERYRPDRPEAITQADHGQVVGLAEGMRVEIHAGAHNSARGMTSGLALFAPGAELPRHTHTFTESLTLLEGEVSVEIEGRRYRVDALDNVMIPAGLAHQTRNLSDKRPAVFHLAMGTDTPSRTLVGPAGRIEDMPEDSEGHKGAERVTRFATARRRPAAPDVEWVNFFDGEKVPGVEIRGELGVIQAGGEIPARLYGSDSSLCIVRGECELKVEGRSYLLAGRATALLPRGRIHCLRNAGPGPAVVIHIGAGSREVGVKVEPSLAEAAGAAWGGEERR